MYLGKIVELGPVEAIYGDPQHPYSRALLSARPSMDPRRRTHEAPIQGDPPNPIDPPSMHAGSSVLGYAPSKKYDAGQRAVLTIEALKQGYRMRQVAGWPIKALNVYCVVLEPPQGMRHDCNAFQNSRRSRIRRGGWCGSASPATSRPGSTWW